MIIEISKATFLKGSYLAIILTFFFPLVEMLRESLINQFVSKEKQATPGKRQNHKRERMSRNPRIIIPSN